MKPVPSRAAPLPPQQRRAAIIAAAIPLVCDHGATVTTREIAEAAGIAEGTIFRVFPDKDALITAVVDTVLDPAPFVAELGRIDPSASLERILTAAVDALRRRIENVWQIMWMLRVSGPPGNEQDTSEFVVVRGSGLPRITPPDMTEATTALAELLIPYRQQLRVPPAQAARMFRLITFANAHPRISEGEPLTTPEIVQLLLHGISDAKSVSLQPVQGEDFPGPDGQRAAAFATPLLEASDVAQVAAHLSAPLPGAAGPGGVLPTHRHHRVVVSAAAERRDHR